MKTLIAGGRVIDPENRVDSVMDLLCENGKIIQAGKSLSGMGEIIDATGKIVAPGFIDIHMHEDPLDENGEIVPSVFNCMLRMGVTTAVAGNCGDNVCDPILYLDRCDRGVPVNVAMLAGHSYARKAAGAADRYAPATEAQKRQIEKDLRDALAAGCAGISFGLRYVPGTDTDEFWRAAAVCSGTGKPVAAHVRDDADAVFDAIDEMVCAAKRFDLPLQISHIGSMAGFGQMNAVLAYLDAERLNGLDVTLDCYPYDAFCTELGATTYDDGWLERYRCGYEVLEYCEGELAGHRADAHSFERMRREYPDSLTICHVMREEDIRSALCHPAVMVGSDGILNGESGHPRAAGTFPRIFARYVRSGILTLNEAIAKMTCMPAAKLHLPNKGTLAVGADADIVIFDPERICDRATFAEPVLSPEGIEAVLISGKIAARNGKIENGMLGRSVRV